MNLNNFTIKSQEAIQQVFTIAQDYNHQAIEPAHLLKGLIFQNESIIGFILRKMGVNPSTFDAVLTKMLESYPKVGGGEKYLSPSSNRVLQKSNDFSNELSDQFVSVEHILLGLLADGDQVSQMMKDAGITEKELTLAIIELRKGAKVESQTVEETYNALNRFALNLNEMARSG